MSHLSAHYIVMIKWYMIHTGFEKKFLTRSRLGLLGFLHPLWTTSIRSYALFSLETYLESKWNHLGQQALNRRSFVGPDITLRNLRFRCMYFWSIKSLVKLKDDEMSVPTKVIWMFAKEVCYIISLTCSTIILRPPKREQEKQLYTVVARLKVTARWQTTIAMNIFYLFVCLLVCFFFTDMR